MKKLLAIAVAAAITAPMMASADTTAYGSARMTLGQQSVYNAAGTALITAGSDATTLRNNSSRIGLKGSNALNRGLTATHKFELGVDPTGTAGGVTNRSSYVGLKGGFGEIRGGSDWTVMDNVDDGAAVLTNGSGSIHGGKFTGTVYDPTPVGANYNTDGDRKGSIKYLGKFGPVGVLASYRPSGNRAAISATNVSETKAQLGLTYKAGPFYAGIATDSNAGANNPMEVALAYNGANYRVGFVTSKDVAGDKANSLRGKYSFGNAYVAAQLGKKKAGVNAELKQTDLEAGYKLGKGTKVYLQSKKITEAGITRKKGLALGMQHDF